MQYERECDCEDCREMNAYIEQHGGERETAVELSRLTGELEALLRGLPVKAAGAVIHEYLESNKPVAKYDAMLAMQDAINMVKSAAVSRMRPMGEA